MNSNTSLPKSFPEDKSTEIDFKSNGFLTIGTEVELQIIDSQSLNLVPKSQEILKNIDAKSAKNIKPEFFLNTLEVNSNKCLTVVEVEQDLGKFFDTVIAIGDSMEINFATTGHYPLCRYSNPCPILSNTRNDKLVDNIRWILNFTNIYGLHIHLGMKSGEECISFNNFFSYFLPHFLAFSASSPFYKGSDTGLASCRAASYGTLPTVGIAHPMKNWDEFTNFYHNLKRCKTISSLKDLWWDIRPSPNFGTLEIRICDGVATLEETLAIVAYIHLLAHWFNDNRNHIGSTLNESIWLMRENKWRVMRDGLDAELVTNINAEVVPIRDDILQWLDKVSKYSKELNYEKYITTLKNIMINGNSSKRQKKIYQNTKSMQEVIKFNIKEFVGRKPIY